ncbi:TPA: lysine--tRNA ligase [Candidatus Uhrbacteria bacterium]|nr:lysine--tRNA ligase [Candidatus Uhrbacteria bacterium]
MSGDEKLMRRTRLASLREQGIEPYPAELERTHTIAKVVGQFAELETAGASVTIVGRVKALRQMGGLTFIRLVDGTGDMQVVLKEDQVGAEQYQLFINHADVGDFFGFTGGMYITQKGERSVLAGTFTILAKALSPLPDKWSGLQDVELRYRHRELDLISNPEVRKRFEVRSKIVSTMRRFLDERGFMEVETPILQPIPGGASARPFVTHHNALDAELYLRIAPELYLKRLVVGGFEKIYEIGRCFRNEGIDYAHNPEFTMMELYWAYADKNSFVAMLEELVVTIVDASFGGLVVPYGEGTIDFTAPWKKVTFRQAIIDACGIDIDTIHSSAELFVAIKAAKLKIDFKGCVGMGEFYDQLYKKTARAVITQPTWVFDYPIELKPLAKANPADPTKSSSVQLVVQGAEIINAYYYELNDPLDQRARFEEQQALREQGSEEAQWMDEDFLSALEHAMPPTSGVGIGIDRLVAFLTNSPSLKEVILFPTLKPVKVSPPPDMGELEGAL